MRDRATLTISTVIVDDEQLASDELAYLLKDFPDVELSQEEIEALMAEVGENGFQA